jgi:flagellar hook-associated protein 3 FlgL
MSARITQNTISQTALRGLQGNLSRVQALQQQLSSGRRISQPSDDPSATAASMTFRSEQAGDDQYLRNADQVAGRLSVTDNALTQLSDRLRAVREQLVASQNGALSTDGRAALGANIDSIRSEVLSLYNTTYLDRPVFGGTIQGRQAVDPTTGAYLGNDAPIESRISADTVVRLDVQGSAAAADTVPGVLAAASANVSGPNGAQPSDFAAIDAAMSKVQQALGDVGAREARVDTTKANVDSHRLDLVARISQNEDVDLPQAIMNLQAQQVGYQAALGAAAKIVQTSLIDFLK